LQQCIDTESKGRKRKQEEISQDCSDESGHCEGHTCSAGKNELEDTAFDFEDILQGFEDNGEADLDDPDFEDLLDKEDADVDDADNSFQDPERNPHILEHLGALDIEEISDSDNTFSDKERYLAAGLQPDEVERCRASFEAQLVAIVDHISHRVRHANYKDTASLSSWVNKPNWPFYRVAKSNNITKGLLEMIPPSTRAILGKPGIKPVDLLALPHVTHKPNQMGVYLCYVEDSRGWGALYIGSTLVCLFGRQKDHKRLIEAARRNGTEIAFYKYITSDSRRTYHFRQIAMVPQREGTDRLVRLLEAAIMIQLDCFAAGTTSGKHTIGTAELHSIQTACNIEKNQYEPLNHAIPTKQGSHRTSNRSCSHCLITRELLGGSIRWYFDTKDESAMKMLCERCYKYEKRTGHPRPLAPNHLEIMMAFKGLTKEGPCSNPACGATDAQWRWHPDHSTPRVVCVQCYHWARKNGTDRPEDAILGIKVCIDCEQSSTQKHRKTGDGRYRCFDCHKRYIKDNGLENRTCIVCGDDCDPHLMDARMCPECTSNQSSLKDDAESSCCCWNCQKAFGDGVHRRWAWTIREFLCRTCFDAWEVDVLRIMPEHIKDLDLRCSDCGRKYAKRWTFLKKDGLDKLLCAPCTMAFQQNKTVRDLNRHNDARKKDEYTFYEHRCKKTRYDSKPAVYDYFRTVHGKDWRRAAVEEEKWKHDCLNPTPSFRSLVEAGHIC
jgi:hypothetical protein